mgnify:FL=1
MCCENQPPVTYPRVDDPSRVQGGTEDECGPSYDSASGRVINTSAILSGQVHDIEGAIRDDEIAAVDCSSIGGRILAES